MFLANQRVVSAGKLVSSDRSNSHGQPITDKGPGQRGTTKGDQRGRGAAA